MKIKSDIAKIDNFIIKKWENLHNKFPKYEDSSAYQYLSLWGYK